MRTGPNGGSGTTLALIGQVQALAHAGVRVLVEVGWRTTVEVAAGAAAVGLTRRTGPDRVRMDPPLPSRARMVADADEARRRIERALHDGSQQRLVTLVLEVQAVKNAVPSGHPDLLAQVSQVEDGLRAALEELREIARGIHPAILSQGGLRPALKSLARRSALPVELKLELGPVQRLPESVEAAVYYVVSEALTNAVKHAHASILIVEATAADHTLHVRVRDDGIGGADPTRGSGVLGLKERVEILGGTLTLRSSPGAGTTLHLELPLENGNGRFARSRQYHRHLRRCGNSV